MRPRAGEKIALLATGLGPLTPGGRPTRACQVLLGGERIFVESRRVWQRRVHPGVFEVQLRIPRRVSGPAGVRLIAGGRSSNSLVLEVEAS